MFEQLGNLGAVLNIFANMADIIGITSIIDYVIGALSVLFLRKWLTSAKLAVVGTVAFLLGSHTNGFVHWIITSIQDAGISMSSAEPWLWLIGIVGLLIVFCFALISYFLPAIITVNSNKQNGKLILALNIVIGWIPFVWNVLLFISLMNRKTKAST